MVLHVKFESHSNWDSLTYFTAKNRSTSFIWINGLKNHIEASDLVHIHIVSVLIRIFVMVGQFFDPLVDKNTSKGVLLELPAIGKFSGLFCTCFEISNRNLAYTSSGWCHTSSSSFIPIGTFWSILQPKISQSHLSAFMALKLYRGLTFGTHSNSECIDTYWFLSCLGNLWPSSGQKHSKGWVSTAPSQPLE